MSNEIVASNVYEIIASQSDTFVKVLSDDSILWEREKQFAGQLLMANDYLNNIAWKNQQSLKNAIINLSTIGISLNPAVKHAYLVPRDGKVCLDISYIGLMHLAQKTGSILWGQSAIVRANDDYVNQGIDVAPSHKYNAFASNADRGVIVGAYCVVKTADGSYLTDQMNIEDLHKVRGTSKAFTSGKKCPWTDWEEEMMRKTVVKRASKYWPTVERLSTAISVLNEHEGLRDYEEKDVTPKAVQLSVDDPKKALSSWLLSEGKEVSAFCGWASSKLNREIKEINDLSDGEAAQIYSSMSNSK